MLATHVSFFFFFFNDTATTEIYTLSLHDALPISSAAHERVMGHASHFVHLLQSLAQDRKSTRLNSSHQIISYAVFCLKKKKNSTRARSVHCNIPGCSRQPPDLDVRSYCGPPLRHS